MRANANISRRFCYRKETDSRKEDLMQNVDKFKITFVLVPANDEFWVHCWGSKISGTLGS